MYRSSRQEVFCKKGVLRNFSRFTENNLCQSLFFKKEILAHVFSFEFCEISKNTYSYRRPPVAAYSFCNIHRETAVLESLFNKDAGLKTCNFIKKKLLHMFSCKHCKISKNNYLFWRTLENDCSAMLIIVPAY